MKIKLRYFQKGFNFSQDGPGNRLVVHLQGCNLKCPWCANPEGLLPGGTLVVKDKANPEYCPNRAVSEGRLNRNICSGCPEKTCLNSPASGIRRSYTEEDVSSLLEFIESCRMMFFSGGGVTFTGGEPTIQFEALKEILTALKKRGINTALECNATNSRLPELFPLVDFLITDCKHHNSELHQKVCGAPLDNIISNIKLASKQREQLLIRIPLIGGFNASKDDAESFAALFTEICSPACSFEFLRYHEFGKNKYAECGLDYTMNDEAKIPVDTVEMFNEIFNKNSLKTVHT